MRGGKRWHGHEGFCSMNFGVEGLSKSDFKKKKWLKVLGFKGWGSWNFGVVGQGFPNFFLDFVRHEVVKVCRILQSLQAKI